MKSRKNNSSKTAMIAAIAIVGALAWGGVGYAQTTTGPVISGVSVSSSDTSATVTWNTDVAATSQVFFGFTSTYNESTLIDTNHVTSHSVQLTGLAPATTYHFQAVSENMAGIAATSSDQVFTTGMIGATSTSSTSTSTSSSTTSTSTSSSTATSTVNATTTAPVAVSGAITTTANAPVNGTLSAHDTNTPANGLTFFLTSNPSNGSITALNTSNGNFTYTPSGSFTGTDSFTFAVNNGSINSPNATETITVNASSSTTSTSTATSTGIGTVNGMTAHLINGTFDQAMFKVVVNGPDFSPFANTDVKIDLIDPSTNQVIDTEIGPGTKFATGTITASTATGGSFAAPGVEDDWFVSSNSCSGHAPSGTDKVTVSIVDHDTGVSIARFDNIGSATFTFVPSATCATPETLLTSGGTTTSTSTASTGDIQALENAIHRLEQLVAVLRDQVQALLMGHHHDNDNDNGNSGGVSMGTNGMAATIDPQNATVREGSSVDFNGRNFGREEPVTVTSDGMTMMTAHADGGGNFSTGSITVPMTAGQKTYTFHGMTSGITVSDTITIVP